MVLFSRTRMCEAVFLRIQLLRTFEFCSMHLPSIGHGKGCNWTESPYRRESCSGHLQSIGDGSLQTRRNNRPSEKLYKWTSKPIQDNEVDCTTRLA